MSESVRVLFPQPRDVFVDGARCGATNDVFTVETGTHTFDLGPTGDYSPPRVRIRVSGTSPLAPKIIAFQMVEA